MLQSPHHPHSHLLDTVQQLLIFLELGSPELDTALQMRPHQGRVEGKENLPRPAAHTPLDAPQDPVGFLGRCLVTSVSALPSSPPRRGQVSMTSFLLLFRHETVLK